MDETFTYQQLDNALLQLGFDRIITEEFILYRKDSRDALVALPPNVKMDEPVSFWHWGSARNAVVGRGLATLSEFLNLLRQSAKGVTSNNGATNGAGATPSVTPVPVTTA